MLFIVIILFVFKAFENKVFFKVFMKKSEVNIFLLKILFWMKVKQTENKFISL